jgi:hypothetical protein
MQFGFWQLTDKLAESFFIFVSDGVIHNGFLTLLRLSLT